MKRLDYATAVLMLILSSVVVFGTQELEFWDDYGPGSRFMPLWVAGAMALLSLLLILETNRRADEPATNLPDRAGAIRVVLVLAAIIAYGASALWLGFVLVTAAFVLIVLLLIERRPLLPSLFTAAVSAVLIQAIFVSWLGIALPKSALGI
jgi:putative tricarboxylic transport membrane protein